MGPAFLLVGVGGGQRPPVARLRLCERAGCDPKVGRGPHPAVQRRSYPLLLVLRPHHFRWLEGGLEFFGLSGSSEGEASGGTLGRPSIRLH